MTREKLQIPFPVIVEGRYDRLRLECVMEGQILTTDGFGVFRRQEKTQLFRALAERTPLILLTDSDGAGKLIRAHLTSVLPADRLIQLYIPRVAGTERRKQQPSAEGTLGVEGMEQALLYDLLAPYANPAAVERARKNPLSKTDLYLDGLTGCPDSAARRDALAQRLKLPPGMTPNAFLAALRVLLTYEEYLAAVGRNGI
ncbi:MAG: DUF4093 domain-containing protein [Eubacteriales bacterium]|nr:DUF4093 domain-containing protein [Eubacteriales bacterium]